MKTSVHLLLPLAAALVASGADEPPPRPSSEGADSEYTLLLSTGPKGFEGEELTVGGPGLDGRVIVFLNDNPIDCFACSGRAQPITGYLRKGWNTLAFDGKHSGTLYVRVARGSGDGVRPGTEAEVVGRWKIQPSTTKRPTEPVRFQAEGIPPLPLYGSQAASGLDEAGEKELESALSGRVEKLRKAFSKAKADRVLDLLLSDKGSFRSAYSKAKRKAFRKSQRASLTSLMSLEPKALAAEPRFVVGDRLVMVYSELAGDPYRTPYLFPIDLGDKQMYFPALRFAKIDGAWVVWK